MSDQYVNNPCKVCGLSFTNRAKWSKRNQTVLYCSQRCRRNKPTKTTRERQERLLNLLKQYKKPVCMNDILTQVGFPATDHGRREGKWAIHRLYHLGKLKLLKEGRSIHPDQNKGRVFIDYIQS